MSKIASFGRELISEGRAIGAQAVVAVATRTAGALSLFGVTYVAARGLGSERAGLFFLAISVVTMLATLSRLGLDISVLRFVGASHDSPNSVAARSVVRKSVLASGALATIISLLVWIFREQIAVHLFSKPDFAPVIGAAAPGIAFLAVNHVIASALRGRRWIGSSVIMMTVAANALVVVGITGVLGLKGDLSPQTAAAIYAVAVCTSVLIGFALWRRADRTSRAASAAAALESSDATGAASTEVGWRELSRSCMPLWAAAIVGQLTIWSSQVVVGIWLVSSELSSFVAAQRTAGLVGFVLLAFNYVVAPRFATYYAAGDMERLYRTAVGATRLSVAFAIPVMAMFALFPREILGIFGEGFADGAIVLRILIMGQAVNVLVGSVGFLLSMSGHERDLRNASMLGGAVAVVGALVLVPLFGIAGAAIASACAISVQNIVSAVWVERRLGLNMVRIWGPVKYTPTPTDRAT